MKKVLFVATIANHIIGFHSKFLKEFKEKGYIVHTAVGDDNIVKEYCDECFKISLARNPFKLKNIKGIKELRKIIKKEKYDMIHCHTPMGGVVARLAAMQGRKKWGMRVIYTAHGFHFYKGAPIVNWLIFFPIEWFLAKYTDTLITINNEDYEIAKKRFSKRCKDIRLVNGVGTDFKKFDFQITDDEKNKYRKELGLNKDSIILIFPARLDKNKNQILLIKAMEELVKENDNIHLLLPGRDELNGYYQKIVEDKKLTDNIHFLGYRNDIPILLKISDIAVSSSIREGLPINLVEAVYCGIPVVALKNRGHNEIVADENGFLFEGEEDFVNKVKYLMENKKCYNINSMKQTVEKFKSNNIIKKMKVIYNLD